MAEDNSNLIIIPPEAPSQNEMVRLAFALEAISDARRFGDARSDDEVFTASGQYPDSSAFWRALLAVPMRALRFTDLLLTFYADPSESYAKHKIRRLEIEHAICEGLRNGEGWIFRDPLVTDGEGGYLGAMRVHPRDAASWLLKSPWAHIVPASLRAFLEVEQAERRLEPPPAPPAAPVAAVAPPPAPAPAPPPAPTAAPPPPADVTRRGRGRPDDPFQRVARQMREALDQGKLTRDALSKIPGKSLAADYGACRETCQKARRIVLFGVSENARK